MALKIITDQFVYFPKDSPTGFMIARAADNTFHFLMSNELGGCIYTEAVPDELQKQLETIYKPKEEKKNDNKSKLCGNPTRKR